MGVPKAGLLMPDGRSMIETVRDAMERVCEQVVLVGNPHGLRGHFVVTDEEPDSGPLAGIEALLRSGVAGRYLVVPCDMPAIGRTLLTRLLDAGGPGAVHFEGEPLPCVVDACLATETTRVLGDGVRALHLWQDAVGAKGVDATGVVLEDADTPEEFIRLWRRFMEDDHDSGS